jgi:hypothetical protein
MSERFICGAGRTVTFRSQLDIGGSIASLYINTVNDQPPSGDGRLGTTACNEMYFHQMKQCRRCLDQPQKPCDFATTLFQYPGSIKLHR